MSSRTSHKDLRWRLCVILSRRHWVSQLAGSLGRDRTGDSLLQGSTALGKRPVTGEYDVVEITFVSQLIEENRQRIDWILHEPSLPSYPVAGPVILGDLDKFLLAHSRPSDSIWPNLRHHRGPG